MDIAPTPQAPEVPQSNNTPPPPATPSAGNEGASQNGSNSQSSGSNAPLPNELKSAMNEGKEVKEAPKDDFETRLNEVKVNGKVEKWTLQELKDKASFAHAANSRFEEAKRDRQEIEAYKELLKKDPIQALLDPKLGLTKEQIRERMEQWYSKEYIEPETLTEEQRKIRDYEAQLHHYAEQEKEAKARVEQEQLETQTQQQRQLYQTQIIDALEGAKVPRSAEMVSRVAMYMKQAADQNWDVPMDFIVRQAQRDQQESFRNQFGEATGEQIIKILGDSVVSKIIKHHLDAIRAGREAKAPPFSKQNGLDQHPERHERLSSSDVKRRLREMTS